MNSFSKFKGCNRVFCFKSWRWFEAGRTYNCKVSRGINGIPHLSIEVGTGYVGFYEGDKYSNSILETFRPIAEHRKRIIEDLL